MEISIHDNILYSYRVDFGDYSRPVYELVLYTEYFGTDQVVEYTDIIFSNVITHRFETITSKTVIFDIEETEPQAIYQQEEGIFLRLKNYGWPFLYKDVGELFLMLKKMNIRGFQVHSSCGLDGWVWAEKMTLVSRTARKEFN